MLEKIRENNLLEVAKKAAVEAGKEILKVYKEDFLVSYKEDNSPLTLADKKANNIIEKLLDETNIPILSEEGLHLNYSHRKKWKLL